MFALLWTALLGCGNADDNQPTCLETDRIRVWFDADRDGFGTPGTERTICPTERGAPEGFATNDDDCNDAVASVNPGALEECDGRDNDCDDVADEGLRIVLFFLDADGDGFGSPDLSLTIESCAPPLGFVENRQDCNDDDAAINPLALEICDNRDNDCNLLIDDDDPFLDLEQAPRWYEDVDLDGFGNEDEDRVVIQCTPPDSNFTNDNQDCDDTRPEISPNAAEVCNRIDDDCDDLIDDSDPDIDPNEQVLFYADDDLDGAGDPNVTQLACFQPWFFVDNDIDCDDDEPLLTVPAPWWVDGDSDGFGAGDQSEPLCVRPTSDHVLVARGEDCDDTNIFNNPDATEICDGLVGVDNDCDGLIDTDDPSLDDSTTFQFWADIDQDGFGDPLVSEFACSASMGFIDNFDDCDDGDRDVFPGSIEVCDGIDNNCDALIDDLDPNVDLTGAPTFWADADNDGYGDLNTPFQACLQPDGFVDNSVDCDDTDDSQLVDGTWLFDLDGDGVGEGVESTEVQCTAPFANYVPSFNGVDCAPGDPDRFPGNEEICNNGIDEDCVNGDLPCFP
ncbi:MAG: putative metal-binding motif-containing protein [Myxococcota bacterium]